MKAGDIKVGKYYVIRFVGGKFIAEVIGGYGVVCEGCFTTKPMHPSAFTLSVVLVERFMREASEEELLLEMLE